MKNNTCCRSLQKWSEIELSSPPLVLWKICVITKWNSLEKIKSAVWRAQNCMAWLVKNKQTCALCSDHHTNVYVSVKRVEVIFKWIKKKGFPLPLQSCNSWIFVKEKLDRKKKFSLNSRGKFLCQYQTSRRVTTGSIAFLFQIFGYFTAF